MNNGHLSSRKNWQAICNIVNVHFRLYVSLCENEAELVQVRRGFPGLFHEVAPEERGPFPLSLIRQRLAEYVGGEEQGSHCEFIGGMGSDGALSKQFGIPTFLYVHPECRELVGKPGAKIAPPDIVGRYKERFVADECLFPNKLVELEIDGEKHYLGWIGTTTGGDQPEEIGMNFLTVPARFIDPNA